MSVGKHMRTAVAAILLLSLLAAFLFSSADVTKRRTRFIADVPQQVIEIAPAISSVEPVCVSAVVLVDSGHRVAAQGRAPPSFSA